MPRRENERAATANINNGASPEDRKKLPLAIDERQVDSGQCQSGSLHEKDAHLLSLLQQTSSISAIPWSVKSYCGSRLQQWQLQQGYTIESRNPKVNDITNEYTRPGECIWSPAAQQDLGKEIKFSPLWEQSIWKILTNS